VVLHLHHHLRTLSRLQSLNLPLLVMPDTGVRDHEHVDGRH